MDIPEPKSAMDSIFDMREAMARCFDREMFRQMVDFFFAESPIALAEIRAALTRGDLKKIAATAHTLRGTISYLGSKTCFDAATNLEQSATDGDRAATAEAVETFSDRIERLKKAIAPFRSAKPEGAENSPNT
jgi:HPt (histidine-containing phosphotransfer) domain-containing protein